MDDEEKYILIRDLTTISAAKRVLTFMTPETSNYIGERDFSWMMNKLSEWERIHFEALHEDKSQS